MKCPSLLRTQLGCHGQQPGGQPGSSEGVREAGEAQAMGPGAPPGAPHPQAISESGTEGAGAEA